MKTTNRRKTIFTLMLAVAVVCIGVGGCKVWQAFKNFDGSIMSEKDKQLEKLLNSEDANIEQEMDAFIREASALFSRITIENAEDTLIGTGDTAALERAFTAESISVTNSPLYAGRIVYYNGKYNRKLSTVSKGKFLTKTDDKGLSICRTADNDYYLAYRHKSGKIKYYLLISMQNLLNDVVGEDEDYDDMAFMMDATAAYAVFKNGERVEVISVGENVQTDVNNCVRFMAECQITNISGATSIDMQTGTQDEFVARLLVKTSNDTKNGFFAIGRSANYDETLRPSRDAANQILIFGGIAVLGVVLIITLLILIRRFTGAELDEMRRRNETMEEINRKMQVLTHHQRLETIGTMTAGIAHDFNNLLTPIMGYSMMTMEMLPKDATDLQENLMEVYNASVKAKDIVSRLAELSKKGEESSLIELNPDEVLQSALKVTLPAKPKSVEVKVSMNCKRHNIKGDKTQLSQLIMNLVLNAYDAMAENGGGTLLISTRCTDEKVSIKIKDNGPGMDAETVAQVFDPFFTTKESGKGTGLGLAIVAQIVEQHGAKIYVDSTPGEGTEFRVVFDELKKAD